MFVTHSSQTLQTNDSLFMQNSSRQLQTVFVRSATTAYKNNCSDNPCFNRNTNAMLNLVETEVPFALFNN